MAVYSVSSSGNLKFADTGLGSPVSFFAYEGFVTNPLAGAPLTGQLAQVWIIPASNRFSSSGSLELSGTIVRSQSSIAASAIGESPTAGGENSNVEISTRLGFISGVLQSVGNLTLTGSSTSKKVYNKQSAGNLKTTGAVSSPATVKRQTAGNLKLTGSTAARAIFATKSAGRLTVTGSDSFRDIEQTTSAGRLTITGSTVSHKTYNKTSAGQVNFSGSVYINLILVPMSSGNLVVTTKTYDPTYQGGVATNSVASIYEDLPATLRTTITSFYGDIHSSGSLTITPTGEIVAPLSSTSVVAGSALAETALAGGMDTERRASTFTTFYAPTSSGLLHIQGPSTSIQYDNDTAGNLTISSSTTPAFVRGFLTSGNLRTNGTNITVRTLGFNTVGNIVLADNNGFTTSELSNSSGIAGSAVASIPVGGSSDYYSAYHFAKTLGYNSAGNLVLNGAEVDTETLDFLSSGQLKLTGQTVIEQQLFVRSAGRLSISGSSVTVRTLHFNTAGNVVLPDINGFTTAPLSASSGIAGSAIASTPVGGSSDYYKAYHFAKTLGYDSAGNLKINGSTGYTKRLDFLSAGNLSIIGITGTGQQNLVLSEGYLSTSGNNITVRTLHFDTAGSAKLVDVSRYITARLGDSSGIAGSALAAQPVGSGIDLYKGFDFVRNLGFPSLGSLVTNGNHVSNRTLNFNSAGYLTIAGTDVLQETEYPRSAGNLVITGQTKFASALHFDTAGNETFGNTNGFTNSSLSNSSGIAGSAIAATPVGGSSDYYRAYGFQTSLTFDTAGDLITSSSSSFNKTLDFLSHGYLTITGITGSGNQSLVDSAGDLTISGNSIVVRTLNFNTSGSEAYSSTGFKQELTAAGTLAGSAIADLEGLLYSHIEVSLGHTRTSAGELDINSSTTFNRRLGFNSRGNLVVLGNHAFARSWGERTSGRVVTNGANTFAKSWGVASSGREVFKTTTLSGQSSIAASALGEYPLAGGVDNIFQTQVQYVKGSLGFASAGNLIISGSTFERSTKRRDSTGLLDIITSDAYTVRYNTRSAGQLKIYRGSLAQIHLNERTAGSLRITSNPLVELVKLVPTSSGNLVVSGSNITYRRYNKDTAGDLSIISSALASVTLRETTSGSLNFTDHWYDVNSSGTTVAGNGIASSALAGSAENPIGQLRTTVVNFNGIRRSIGNLTISAVGTKLVTDLGPIASGAIATTSLEGSSTSGRLAARVSYISKGVSYSDHLFYVTSSGSLALTGRTSLSKQTFPRTSAGQLKVTGSTRTLISIHATSSGMLHTDGYSTNSGFAVYPITSRGSVKITGATVHSSIAKPISSTIIKVSGNVAYSSTLHIDSAGLIGIIGAATERDLHLEASAGSISIAGASTVETSLVEVSSGALDVTTTSVYTVTSIIDSAGSIGVIGGIEESTGINEHSSGNIRLSGSTEVVVFTQPESAGNVDITTASKYNIVSIISSIGSVGVLGGVEEFTSKTRTTNGRIKVSGKTDIVISIKPGSRGFTRITGGTKTQTILNKEHMGGSGIYYGPWGAPFVMPFAKEWEEVDGKRRRKVSRLQVAIRFSKGERWTRTHYNLNKMNKGVMVAASALRPAQTPSVATAPISNKPKITVNASAFRLIQNNVPNVDVSDFTVVESAKVKVQDFTEKSTLVETGSIKQNNYRINATVDVDTTSFKVTVALPKSTVDA